MFEDQFKFVMIIRIISNSRNVRTTWICSTSKSQINRVGSFHLEKTPTLSPPSAGFSRPSCVRHQAARLEGTKHPHNAVSQCPSSCEKLASNLTSSTNQNSSSMWRCCGAATFHLVCFFLFHEPWCPWNHHKTSGTWPGGTPLAEALLTLNHLQSPWLAVLNEFHPQWDQQDLIKGDSRDSQ